MTAPFLLSFALAYAGFAAVCLALDRHYRQVWGRPPARCTATLLRVVGYPLLGLAAVPCVAALGGATGFVMWLGVLSAAALPLIFLLPFAPRAAALLAVVAPAVAVSLQ